MPRGCSRARASARPAPPAGGTRRLHRASDGGYEPAGAPARGATARPGRRPRDRARGARRPGDDRRRLGRRPCRSGGLRGAARRASPIEYAADRDARAARRAAAREGAELVVSDSNRRRVFVPARLRQNAGATLGPGDPMSEDAALLDPFADRGNEAPHRGASSTAPATCAPRSRPGSPSSQRAGRSAALDGSARSEWLADAHLEEDRRWIEIGFDEPAGRARRSTCFPRGERRPRPSGVEIDGAIAIRSSRAGTGSSSACATWTRCAC